MVDALEAENPGIFTTPTRPSPTCSPPPGCSSWSSCDGSTAAWPTHDPDPVERLRHILTSQVFEMSHNEILHAITIEAVSGGVAERKQWIEESGHFQVGNLAKMTPEDERERMVDEMLTGGQ
jgi:type II restriction enzyme